MNHTEHGNIAMGAPGSLARLEADVEHLAKMRDYLTRTLQEALEVIRLFHGQAGWKEYQSSPEMRRLNEAIAKGTHP